MNSRLRIVLVSLVVIGSVAYLILSGVKATGLHYMTVSELAHARRVPESGGFRLDGRVAIGSVRYEQKAPQLAFQMTDGSQVIGVVYPGLMPDAFGEGREIVVEGTYDRAARTLHASKLVTKCPSKYEAGNLGADKS